MHEYLKRIMKAEASGALDSLKESGVWYHTTVFHDYWCGINRAEECDCDPEISIWEKTDAKKIFKVLKDGAVEEEPVQ